MEDLLYAENIGTEAKQWQLPCLHSKYYGAEYTIYTYLY